MPAILQRLYDPVFMLRENPTEPIGLLHTFLDPLPHPVHVHLFGE